jgi:hypothetical protein
MHNSADNVSTEAWIKLAPQSPVTATAFLCTRERKPTTRRHAALHDYGAVPDTNTFHCSTNTLTTLHNSQIYCSPLNIPPLQRSSLSRRPSRSFHYCSAPLMASSHPRASPHVQSPPSPPHLPPASFSAGVLPLALALDGGEHTLRATARAPACMCRRFVRQDETCARTIPPSSPSAATGRGPTPAPPLADFCCDVPQEYIMMQVMPN